jgi:hypothetical protein
MDEAHIASPSNEIARVYRHVRFPRGIPFPSVEGASAPPFHRRSDIVVSWAQSCADGAEDYGIYEGTIGTWYSHTMKDCSDAGGDRTEPITPGAGNRYYLVVARNALVEGSYGQATSGAERPVGAAVCAASQVVTACP